MDVVQDAALWLEHALASTLHFQVTVLFHQSHRKPYSPGSQAHDSGKKHGSAVTQSKRRAHEIIVDDLLAATVSAKGTAQALSTSVQDVKAG